MLRMIAKLALSTTLALSAAPAALAQDAPSDAEILRRMQALEERVQQLEARNRELEEATARVAENQPTESRGDTIKPAVMVKSGLVPTIGDTEGNFTFKPRGVIEADFGKYWEREGGFDFAGGTNIRRARIGLEGTAYNHFQWRIEADFAESGSADLTDAYIAFTGIDKLTITAGQFKVPYSFEGNSSDNYNTFLESAMFVNAFGAGAGRRIGFGFDYKTDAITAGVAFSGDNNAASRADDVTDESVGVNARATWAPVRGKENQLQVGLGTYWRTDNRTNDVAGAFRVGDRPNVRVDNTRIADSGVVRDVGRVYYLGGEIIGSHGPFSIQAEYGRLWVEREIFATTGVPGGPTVQADDLQYDGFYIMGSWLLTGEQRPLKGGTLDRIKPRQDASLKGGWGAWEVAFRYDDINLRDSPGSRAGNEAHTFTTALNWYLTPNIKMMLNWIRFTGRFSPLDPVGDVARGDALATRFHIDF